MNFDTAVNHILDLEGGYVNHPRDPGGETKYGISRRSYPNEDIRNLTVARAIEIYRRDFWDPCHCDQLPAPLNLFVFDGAVNQGVPTTIRLLQRTLGVRIDGDIGPRTLAAASRANQDTAVQFMAARALRYMGTAHFADFGTGWLRRMFSVALFA